jgi:RPA family protein
MEHNHLVLRLPPYHNDLNPIELLWANIKGDVARNNTTFKLENVQTLTEEAINKISLDTIKSTFDHVKNIENEYWVNDGLQIAPIVETINIPLQESSSSSSNSSSDNSD